RRQQPVHCVTGPPYPGARRRDQPRVPSRDRRRVACYCQSSAPVRLWFAARRGRIFLQAKISAAQWGIMTAVGKVESFWRYPVKSMAGEAIEEAFVGYAGVFGDRCCAFLNSAAPAGFPYLTGRNKGQMLQF